MIWSYIMLYLIPTNIKTYLLYLSQSQFFQKEKDLISQAFFLYKNLFSIYQFFFWLFFFFFYIISSADRRHKHKNGRFNPEIKSCKKQTSGRNTQVKSQQCQAEKFDFKFFVIAVKICFNKAGDKLPYIVCAKDSWTAVAVCPVKTTPLKRHCKKCGVQTHGRRQCVRQKPKQNCAGTGYF